MIEYYSNYKYNANKMKEGDVYDQSSSNSNR
jgi:hypothetical protein